MLPVKNQGPASRGRDYQPVRHPRLFEDATAWTPGPSGVRIADGIAFSGDIVPLKAALAAIQSP